MEYGAYDDDDKLKQLVECVDDYREYWNENVRNYHASRKFLFKTAISVNEAAILERQNKPAIEFNIGEAYISRLVGEFSKQEPSINAFPIEDSVVDVNQLNFIGDHLRYRIASESASGFQYNTYRQTLSGGFSVWKIWTEYSSPMSFEQVIKFGIVFDPTMTGFDVLARQPTKCDGRYCYELFPKTKKELEEMGIDCDDIREVSTNSGYTWTYKGGNKKLYLLCDFYEKYSKPVKILLLPEKKVVTEKQYKQMEKDWVIQGRIEQLPRVLATRTSSQNFVKRYQFVQNKILSEEETIYEELPLIFVDGNSEIIQDTDTAASTQFTRGYTYNLTGAQKLKNFAGQALAGELQNIVQHKWVAAKESIPPQYKDAYKDAQIASILIYNHLYKDDPNVVLPPPREIARTPIPPQISETFQMMDNLSQMILGSFDASREIANNQLSGVTIGKREAQTNTASLPYLVRYMQGLTQLGKCYVTLLPKIVRTPRSMPVMSIDNQPGYVNVAPDQNGAIHPDTVYVNFDPNTVDVCIEAGVNFALQKSQAINEMIMIAKEMPVFNAFMQEKGLSLLVDNMDIKGVDQLKEMTKQYMQEIEEKKNAAANQPTPEQMAMQLNQQKMQVEQEKVAQGNQELQIKAAKISVDEYKAETERMAAEASARTNQQEIVVKQAKAEAENMRSAVDMAISEAAHHHKIGVERATLHHAIAQDNKKKEEK